MDEGGVYYMITFETEAQAHAGLRKVATDSTDPIAAAALGWTPTKNSLFIRFLIEDDFQQPIFELPTTEFKDTSTVIAKAPVRTVTSEPVISKPAVVSKKATVDSKTQAQFKKWSSVKE